MAATVAFHFGARSSYRGVVPTEETADAVETS